MLMLQDPPAATAQTSSLLQMIVSGGPLMIPIGLCSVVSLAFMVERSIRLRDEQLGSRAFARAVVEAYEAKGPEEALRLCRREACSLARVLAAGLVRWADSTIEIEKAVEDAGAREVKRLSANLRPLVVIGMIAPLLGLLGTVWGMIQAFSTIAGQAGLGKPELLATGISTALITTAAGLTVAIPTQAAYYWYKSRIDRFVRRAEDVFEDLEAHLVAERSGAGVRSSA